MYRLVVLISGCLLSLWIGASELRNHPSPYLQLHADDPVAWQTLDESTFARAKKVNKPIFLTLGYFSCYWCHVMQRESFQNEAIAARINRDFVPVVVDRELQPSVDAALIEFAQQFHGQAGWPLNVFLTPDGHPLYATVYLPPEQFDSVLTQMSAKWRTERPRLETISKQITNLFKNQPRMAAMQTSQKQTGKQLQERFVEASLTRADELSGGFGSQSKFPSVPQLQALLQLYEKQPNEELGEFLQLTLAQMATQGLRDHLGGGFFRYTVDPQWQVPHFEKMLYDNAQLAELYLDASHIMGRADYRRVGLDTLQFVHDNMRQANGEYVAAFSAVDGAGVEGGYYLWSKELLQAQLSKGEYQVIEKMWGLDQPPPVEEGYHAVVRMSLSHLAKQLGRDEKQVTRDFKRAKQKLLSYRQTKRALPVDTKTLAAWNGLLLSAYAKAAQLSNQTSSDPGWYKRGQALKDNLIKNHWRGDLLYRLDHQRHDQAGNLEDYAYLISGLVDWAGVSRQESDWLQAKAIADSAWQRFFDPDKGWRLSDRPLLPFMRNEQAMADGPMPAPSAILIRATRKLLLHAADKLLQQRVEQASDMGRDHLNPSQAFWYASHIALIEPTMDR